MGNRNKGIFFPFKTFLTLQIFYNDLKKKKSEEYSFTFPLCKSSTFGRINVITTEPALSVSHLEPCSIRGEVEHV